MSEASVMRRDSARNCRIRAFRGAPMAFRIPTSFMRTDAFAVERFIKLMHAISTINRAMRESSRTESILPPVSTPFS